MIKAAKAVVKCLENEKVSTIFGYPGAAICPVYDALINSKIKHILVRHEVNAAHAASGYARISKKAGVCISTSGPGATNLITGIATAYMDSVPLIIITGQVSTDQIGRDVFQEADITGAAEPFVKHSYLIKNAADIPRIFKEAFYIATTGRPGPVLIDIPVDILNTDIDFKYPDKISIRSYKPTIKGNKLQIKRVCDAINSSQKPLICIGGGAVITDAQAYVKELSDLADIPIISTMMGLSAIDNDNPLYIGMVGLFGTSLANKALSECDLLILVGARVGDRAVRSPSFINSTSKVIHIDIDPAEIGKNIATDIPVVGDAKIILKQILEVYSPHSHKEWSNYIKSFKANTPTYTHNKGCINPRKFINDLSKKCHPHTAVVADVGQNQLWTASSFEFNNAEFLTSGGMGTMGYSLPASIGAKLADKDLNIITICGDGSFQMMMPELATAVNNNLNLSIIIMNNSCLGLIRQIQKDTYNKHYNAISLDGSPDYSLIAKAYGINYIKVYDDKSSDEAIETILSDKGIVIVDCIIDKDEKTID